MKDKNIQTWGCGKTKEQRSFKVKNGKPVVVIDQAVECRYSNVTNEEESNEEDDDDKDGFLLEIDPEELEDKEEGFEGIEQRQKESQEPLLNEVKSNLADFKEASRLRHDKEMEVIRNGFRRFLL